MAGARMGRYVGGGDISEYGGCGGGAKVVGQPHLAQQDVIFVVGVEEGGLSGE